MAVDIYRGQQSGIKSAAKGAGKGALIGAGIGVLAGVLVAGLVSGSDFWQPVDLPEALVAGALLGASGGAVIGAFEGDPLWERITVLGLKRELCRCDTLKSLEVLEGLPAGVTDVEGLASRGAELTLE